MKKIFLSFIFCVLVLPNFINAQNNNENQDLTEQQLEELFKQQEEINKSFVKEGEVASCYEYYNPGSVSINLTQNYNRYNAGDAVFIKGKIKNNNSFPIINVDIKARLVKDIPEANPSTSEIIILEDLNIAENITINSGQEYDIAYSYILPLNVPTGEYEMYFYAVEQDKYDLSGLSYSNSVVGSKIYFDVNGVEKDHIYLDQTNIKINDSVYDVSNSDFVIEPKESTLISIPIYNPSEESKDMTITYKLYSWDDSNLKNLIDTKTEKITVESQSEKILTYMVKTSDNPVYYLSIESKPTNPNKDESVFREYTKSNIRFSVNNSSMTRLNFSTVSNYPIKKGEEASIVTCFYNTNEEVDSFAKIETKLKDLRGNVIAQTLYEGNITPDIDALKKTFKPKTNLSEFILSTIMYDKDGKVIDQIDKVYSCKDINPDLCVKDSSMVTIVISIIIMLLIISGLFLLTKKDFINIEKI